MSDFKKLSVIIPVFNEEKTIQELIRRVKSVPLPELEKELIVVDDGSRDETPQILKQIEGILMLRHDKNRGKGAAVKTGIRAATGELILLQDGDLEYNPEDYDLLLKPLLAREAQLVMGSRFLFEKPKFFTKNGDPFFSHYVGNLLIRNLSNRLYGQKIKDYEACYKVFPRSLIDSVPIEADGFEFDNELISKSLRRGYRIAEVPVRYHSRLYQEGKKITWRHGMVILWTILKWRFLPF